jgi:hypothetical protein
VFDGGQRPTAYRRRIEIGYDEDATGPEDADSLSECRLAVREVVECVDDHDRVGTTIPDWYAAGVAGDASRPLFACPPDHPRRGVYDESIGSVHCSDTASAPAGEVQDPFDRPLRVGECRPQRPGRPGREEVLRACEAIEPADVVHANP